MTKGRRIYIIVSWLLVAACLLIIFSLSAQNAEDSKELSDSFVRKILEWLGLNIPGEVLRKFAHMLEFTGLSVSLFNAVYATWKIKHTYIIAFFVTVLCAVADEIHQVFVPERAFQISDILVDSIGALLGVTASFIILQVILFIKKRGNKNGNTQTL